MQKFSLLTFLLFATLCSAQIGGRATYQFLNLITSPRQAALGGRVITNYDYDPDSGLYNPATINYRQDNQLSVNYVDFLADINYGTVSYAYLWDRRTQVIHGGITYINYGNFDGRDEQGNPTGDFSGQEAALSLGYAYNIPYTDFHIGANIKFISSRLEEFTSLGGAVDLGFIYNYEKWDLNVAAVVRNLGFQFTTFAGVNEQLPLEIDAGVSQIVPNVPIRWHLTLENLQNFNLAFENPALAETDLSGNITPDEVSFVDELIRHVIVGVELFPRGGFNIRLGYNFRRNAELRVADQRSFAGISAGFGIKIGKIRFNYAYARFNSAATSNLIGLNIDLSRKKYF